MWSLASRVWEQAPGRSHNCKIRTQTPDLHRAAREVCTVQIVSLLPPQSSDPSSPSAFLETVTTLSGEFVFLEGVRGINPIVFKISIWPKVLIEIVSKDIHRLGSVPLTRWCETRGELGHSQPIRGLDSEALTNERQDWALRWGDVRRELRHLYWGMCKDNGW